MPRIKTAEFIKDNIVRANINKNNSESEQNKKINHQIIFHKLNDLGKRITFLDDKLRFTDAECALNQNYSNDNLNN